MCDLYTSVQMLDRTNHTPDLHDLPGNVKVSGFENRMFLRPNISLVFFGLRPKVNIRSQVLKRVSGLRPKFKFYSFLVSGLRLYFKIL